MPSSFITYQLGIEIAQPVVVTIGRLGEFLFPAGRYVYTGSARRNMDARIARHLRDNKKLRWHIDWLLAAPGVAIVGVGRSRKDECALNRSVRGQVVASGFGASDCRERCGSHLRYLGEPGGWRRQHAKQVKRPMHQQGGSHDSVEKSGVTRQAED